MEEEIRFIGEKHDEYVSKLDKNLEKDSIGYFSSEHLRMGGGYWAIGSLMLLKSSSDLKRDEMIQFIKACQSPNGGFAGNIGHDPCLVYTHYAILLLCMYNSLEAINTPAVSKYIASLQNTDGSFKGDEWGEVDTRFAYCAVSALTILNHIHLINTESTCKFIVQCQGVEGAFGAVPMAESHAAYTFCSVGVLAILGKLHLIDRDLLAAWLSNRQTISGGFNGRPEKLPDVCYSWWILSTLCMIGREKWCSFVDLKRYILECQDMETGGVSDRQGNCVDVFHTFFGIAALSLMGYYDLLDIDPKFAIPVDTINTVLPHISLLYK